MKNISTQVQLIQCQIEILKTLLLCGQLAEHDAKWLKNAKTVMRDKSGKFASRAAQIKEDATAIAQTGGQLLDISANAISNMVKDPGFRERAGLQASSMMGKAIGNLVAQAKIFPGLEKEIDGFIAQQEKKLSDIYGKDNDALKQAFRKTKLPQPPKDASLKDKLEFQVARYKAYEEALENPEHKTNPSNLAVIAKASVSFAAGIGLAIAPEILIPLLLGSELSIPALATSSAIYYGASEATSFGVGKVLDKTGLSDSQKEMADIAVRVLTGVVTGGAVSGKKISKIKSWRDSSKKTKQKIKDILVSPIEEIPKETEKVMVSSAGQKMAISKEEHEDIVAFVRDSTPVQTLLRAKPSPHGFSLYKKGKSAFTEATKDFLDTSNETINQYRPEWITGIVTGLKRLPVLKRTDPLIRAVHDFPGLSKLKPGDIFHEPGFTSASLDPTGVKNFNPDQYPVRLIITPREGLSLAKDISGIGAAGEALYPPGMNFKIREIKDVSRHGSKTVKEVYIEEVGLSL